MRLRPDWQRSLRNCIPWWTKVVGKLLLVAIPVSHATLRKLGLTRHGDMETPEWAYEIFGQHLDQSKTGPIPQGFTVLELGPGDSVFTALLAHAAGAHRTYIVDVAPMATTDVGLYRRMAAFLKAKGLVSPDLSDATTLEDVLAACNAQYLTAGLDSLRELPTASVDFIFSCSVLQHVHLAELPQTLAQLRRVIRQSGVSVHSIDLRDMMGQTLHHLKFPSPIWESAPFRHAAFYTNRLRRDEMLTVFRNAGFKAESVEDKRWPQLPVSRDRLATHYRRMSEEQLKVWGTILVARPV